ncbi:MAG: PEP-CTERM sorting domain-containing protein [Telluria sp.]
MINRLLLVLLAFLSISVSASAAPITVQSVLFDWDQNVLTIGPQTIDNSGNTVTNGDFTIQGSGADIPVGNGIDEWTKGLFDFRSDSNYAAFSNLLALPHGKIFGATLRLILAPQDPLFTNDQFNLENGPFVGEPMVGDQLTNNPYLANGRSKEIVIDLLDFYSQQQLANFLSGGTGDFVNDGRILLTYADDSIVSGASLTLTANVPEPTSFFLLGAGLAALWSTRRRTKT